MNHPVKLCLWLCLGLRSVHGQDTPAFTEVVARYVTGIGELRQGSGDAVEAVTYTRSTAADGSRLPAPVLRQSRSRVFFAFDAERGVFRFDREVEGGESRPSSGKLLRLEDRTILWNHRLAAYIEEVNSNAGLILRPVDYRALGIAPVKQLEQASGQRWESLLENFTASPDEFQVLAVDRHLQCARFVETQLGDSGTQVIIGMEVTFDAGGDFRPVRFATTVQPADLAGQYPPHVQDETLVRWESIHGVRLPVHVTARSGSTTDGELREIEITWDAINNGPQLEPVFTIDGLDLPDGVEVVDLRSGRPIILNQIPEEIGYPDTSVSVQPAGRTWVSIIGICAMLLAVGGWLWRSQMRKSRSNL